jgi:hypothetical protein
MVSSAVTRVYIPALVRRQGRILLNQQCWLWGQDVRRAEGNLLLDFGFERLRAPEEITGSSQYTLALGKNDFLRLWGFGLFMEASGEAFISTAMTSLRGSHRQLEKAGNRWRRCVVFRQFRILFCLKKL